MRKKEWKIYKKWNCHGVVDWDWDLAAAVVAPFPYSSSFGSRDGAHHHDAWKRSGGGDIHHPSDDLIVVKMLTRRVPFVRPNERGFFFSFGWQSDLFGHPLFFLGRTRTTYEEEGRRRADQQLVLFSLFTVIRSLAGLLLFPPLPFKYLFIYFYQVPFYFILFLFYLIFWVFFKCAEDFFSGCVAFPLLKIKKHFWCAQHISSIPSIVCRSCFTFFLFFNFYFSSS